METAAIFLEVNSPESNLVSCKVSLVELPGICGRFEILPSHAPLITALTQGQIRYICEDSSEKRLNINSGFVEVKENKVIVCAE